MFYEIIQWLEINYKNCKRDFISALFLMSGIVLVVKPSFLFSGTSGNETLDNSFNVDISKDRIQKNDTGNLKHKAVDWKLWIDVFNKIVFHSKLNPIVFQFSAIYWSVLRGRKWKPLLSWSCNRPFKCNHGIFMCYINLKGE